MLMKEVNNIIQLFEYLHIVTDTCTSHKVNAKALVSPLRLIMTYLPTSTEAHVIFSVDPGAILVELYELHNSAGGNESV